MFDAVKDGAEFLTTFVFAHPGVVVMIMFMTIGQVIKRLVFTKERAGTNRWWRSARISMPLHPMLTGLVLGYFWRNPENADPAWGVEWSMMYFGGWGILSAWLFGFLKRLSKKFDFEMPALIGSSTPPAPIPPDYDPEDDIDTVPEAPMATQRRKRRQRKK